ncbi:MAG: alpha/beta fold hydrolase [Proteobacteria bacterium]|nr:alpha/beta fold hydrolase [Pseudomonadota bacterium]
MTDPAMFPTAATALTLSGPAGALEAAVDVPNAAEARAGVAIVCHPHPQHGGTMHNKVVTMLERALRESGLATVVFNFRGVGASQGSYDDGRGEADDLVAVAQWVQRTHPGDALWLAGFSFGSYVVARAASQLPVKQLILVAPPVSRWDFAQLVAPACPRLVIQGEADEIVDPAAVYAWVAAQPDSPTLVRLPETGHFFHRRLMDLRGVVKNGVRGNLPPARDGIK